MATEDVWRASDCTIANKSTCSSLQWVLVSTCGNGKLFPVLVVALKGKEGGRESEEGEGGKKEGREGEESWREERRRGEKSEKQARYYLEFFGWGRSVCTV